MGRAGLVIQHCIGIVSLSSSQDIWKDLKNIQRYSHLLYGRQGKEIANQHFQDLFLLGFYKKNTEIGQSVCSTFYSIYFLSMSFIFKFLLYSDMKWQPDHYYFNYSNSVKMSRKAILFYLFTSQSTRHIYFFFLNFFKHQSLQYVYFLCLNFTDVYLKKAYLSVSMEKVPHNIMV